jgi:hypothetical protein
VLILSEKRLGSVTQQGMESYGAHGRGRGADEDEETHSSKRGAYADEYEEEEEEDNFKVKVVSSPPHLKCLLS